MEQGEIVGGPLGPADQDGAEAVEPGMGALDDPTPRFGLDVTLGPGFLAAALQVQREAEFFGQGARLVIIEALIEAEMLRALPGRLGARHRNCLQGLAHQLVVVAVGAIDHHPEGYAAAVGQQRALDPAFAPVGRIAAGFFPRRAALCPSPRPAPATSSQSPAARHRPTAPRARRWQTLPPRPIPESAGAPRTKSKYWSRAGHSTDSLSAARRRSHPSPPGPAPAGCGSPTGVSAVAAAAAPSAPTDRSAGASRHHERAAGFSLNQSSQLAFGHFRPADRLGTAGHSLATLFKMPLSMAAR